MVASEIMSTPAVSVGPGTPVSDVAALLADHRIGGVPVVDEGRLVGVVNATDLLHRHEIGSERSAADGPWWNRMFAAETGPSRYVKANATVVRDVMTAAVDVVAEGTPLPEVAARFESPAVRRICVVRGRELIGVITRADLLRAVATRSQHAHSDQGRADEAIETELLAELTRQPWWRPERSIVNVDGGVVQFRGVIEAPDERASARVAAEKIPGVRAVEDHRSRLADLPWSL